ncbi:MAG: hypothetical protein K6E57_02275 [Fibrobacter sp.]|nr:hypothetical protein [Fibrobacter sp.]
MCIERKKLLGTVLAAGAICASTAVAAPQFPFPQQVTYKYGHTATFVDPAVIQSHFNDWKGAWYKDMGDGTARIISPNDSTEMSVSEGIAYGMLIMVYMSSNNGDHQSEFDKLWAYWKKYSKNNGGMNWHVNNNSGRADDGTATDADLDAAMALVMASKQWGKDSYLSDAKALISWIKSNDMESDGRVKAGSNWNPALNSSYVFPAAFRLFKDVTNDSFWETAITNNLKHVSQCQNATTGLMPDWCDWSSHKATSTGAAVSGGSGGFYDDAARTPWRMTMGYQWYGIEDAKKINDKIVGWLDRTTYSNASLIWPGYSLDGASPYNMFVTSTYVGGLGLAMASADNPGYYLETIYDALGNTVGKKKPADGKGEAYYPATLNILYLLSMSGNMPNFYDMSGLTKYTKTEMRQPQTPAGTLLPVNGTASISGYTGWGAYGDKFGVTVVHPDSGSSGLFQQADGSVVGAIEFRIAPEPTYDATADLKYPFAGFALSFDENDSYYDLSNIAKIVINYKSQGVIRFAILDQQTQLDDNEGGEPGIYLHPTDNYTTLEIDVTSANFATSYDAFVKDKFVVPSWVTTILSHDDVMKAVRGFKFEPKMQKGGYGAIYLRQFDMYDNTGKLVTTLRNPNAGLKPIAANKNGLSLNGKTLQYAGLGKNARLEAFDLNGNLVKTLKISGSGAIEVGNLLPSKGTYIIRLCDKSYTKTLRIQR